MKTSKTANSLNFIALYFLFFGWGFVTCLNDLLTPIFKGLFSISHFQANLVAFAFFTAYFIGSLVYVMAAKFGINYFERLGYKGLILLGLALSTLGCLIFIPAAAYKSYELFLSGLFTIGFGFTFLQISANPLVLITGNQETAASRLNLAAGFNSLATAIAPLIGVYVFDELLQVKGNSGNLKYPYIILAGFFMLLAFIVWKFLNTKEEYSASRETGGKLFALNHLNLVFGMLAIFFYVGS
jgi:FHS family L-fucose permease-like MFS transporter